MGKKSHPALRSEEAKGVVKENSTTLILFPYQMPTCLGIQSFQAFWGASSQMGPFPGTLSLRQAYGCSFSAMLSRCSLFHPLTFHLKKKCVYEILKNMYNIYVRN